LLVTSAGSDRKRRGLSDTKYRNPFYFDLMTFVAEADAAAGWTEQEVEDRLDLIDKMIADVIADNRNTANWHSLDFDDTPTQILPAVVGGNPYQLEITRIVAEVFDV